MFLEVVTIIIVVAHLVLEHVKARVKVRAEDLVTVHVRARQVHRLVVVLVLVSVRAVVVIAALFLVREHVNSIARKNVAENVMLSVLHHVIEDSVPAVVLVIALAVVLEHVRSLVNIVAICVVTRHVTEGALAHVSLPVCPRVYFLHIRVL